jgi:hypothetical protein
MWPAVGLSACLLKGSTLNVTALSMLYTDTLAINHSWNFIATPYMSCTVYHLIRQFPSAPPPRMLIHKALSISDYGVPMVLTYVQT